MTPERWQEVKEMFADVLEQKPAERAAYLNKVCTDAALRLQVELMIAAHEQGGSNFMEQPALDTAALQSGTKLGPYTILGRIGSGGMGEVYRAHDPKLKRDVAIKVLPLAFVNDPERLARFRREARMLASLNHPNIATIHGLEDSGTTHALVMELVEGPTLADRIKSGLIPIDEALRIANQISEALEYAHERGIVHRDLKPANVKVTSDDAVKVLDFGLAKALEGHASSIDIANSPTISPMATQAGVLLGTAAYMSPEQAKGKVVDRRADIWAFGCVLYEMLTGKQAFRGESATDTLASVIKEEPDWSQLLAATPIRVRVLLQRCLQKDPKQRLRDIGDARIALEEVLSGAPDRISGVSAAHPAKRWQLWLVSGVAGASILAAVFLLFLYIHQKPLPGQVARFEIPLPEKVVAGDFTLSPDGRTLAFIGIEAHGQSRVWLRSLETLEPRPLDGTEGADGFPIWSPDSRFIAYPALGKLKKVETSGGPSVTLCNVDDGSFGGGAWNREDEIVFGSAAGTLQVAASGGTPSPITSRGSSVMPSFLPDGRHFVYSRQSGPGVTGSGVYLGSIDMKPGDQPSNELLANVSFTDYTPSSDPAIGYLLFVRRANDYGSSGTLMAQAFDNRRLRLTGEAFPISEQVSDGNFSASAMDVLVYIAGGDLGIAATGAIHGRLTWFDRQGKVLGAVGDPGVYRTLALSPDGKRVAFERADPKNGSVWNIWLYEFARGVTTRFTFDSAWDSEPVWSPDGSQIAFGSNRDGGAFDLYQKTSNLAGEDELLFKSGEYKIPSSWSPDGRFLLYDSIFAVPSQLWLLPVGVAEADRKPIPFASSEFDQSAGRFSPDGRWVAYPSDESGRDEIYVRPFETSSATRTASANGPPVTGKWIVSKDGGINPVWRHDGKELFYLSPDGTAMAVEVNTSGVFQARIPKALFKVPAGVLSWDASPDGKRFLMAAPSGANANPSAPAAFTVVLNWRAGLKK